MITFLALIETIDYINKKYKNDLIPNENLLMNYTEYYSLKLQQTNIANIISKLNITPTAVPIGFIQFYLYDDFIGNEKILTNDERIIKDIIE